MKSTNCPISTKREIQVLYGDKTTSEQQGLTRQVKDGGNIEWGQIHMPTEDLFQSTQAWTMLEQLLKKKSLNILEWSGQGLDLNL